MALTPHENVMALPYRWIRFWLVSLFSVGAVVHPSRLTFGCQKMKLLTLSFLLFSFASGSFAQSVSNGGSVTNGGSANASAVVSSVSDGGSGRKTVSLNYTATVSGAGEAGVAVRHFNASGGILSTVNFLVRSSPGTSSGSVSFTTPDGVGSYSRLWAFATSSVEPIVYYSSTGGAKEAFFYTTVVQTVTVTPNAPSIRSGGTVNFVASGGQNGYNWTATNGGSLSYSGANAGFTATAPATYIVQVWSPAGGGYSESNYATATITVTDSDKVKVNLPKNDTGKPIEYLFIIDGATIGTAVQNIGAAARTVDVTVPPQYPASSQVQVWFKVLGIVEDSTTGTWSKLDGAVTTKQITTATASPTPAPTTVTAPNVPKTNEDNTGKEVWSSASTNTALTDTSYREGIDKTNSALAAINKTLNDKLSTGTGGTIENGETSDIGTHDRLDSIAEKMDADAARIQAAIDANPTSGQTASAGASAASSESSKIPGITGPSSVGGGASAPVFGVSMPSAFGGHTFDLNPFQSARFASICAWHRKACEWLAVILFGLWCAKEASAMIRGLNQANQAKGNTIAVGTGGQATALIAAAAITVVVAIAIVAVCTFASTNLGGGTLLSVVDDDPFSGLIGGAVWMLDQLFPLGAVISCFAGRLVWQAAAQSAYTTAAAVIRFIVP